MALAGLVDAEVGLVEMESASAEREVVEVKNPFGVEGLIEETALEMEVWAGGIAGGAAEADEVACGDGLVGVDVDFGRPLGWRMTTQLP